MSKSNPGYVSRLGCSVFSRETEVAGGHDGPPFFARIGRRQALNANVDCVTLYTAAWSKRLKNVASNQQGVRLYFGVRCRLINASRRSVKPERPVSLCLPLGSRLFALERSVRHARCSRLQENQGGI